MKKIITIICCLVGCGISTAQTTYSLEQLKQLAVENNYSLRSARNAIQQSKEVKSEAFTKFFPQISATGFGFQNSKPLIDYDVELPDIISQLIPQGLIPANISLMKKGLYGSVSAVQPVFMGGQIINGNKLAKVGIEASELQMEVSADQVEQTTEDYYWQVVSLKEKLKTPSALSGISPVKGESHAGSGIPTRLDLAGTWIDQPYVSTYAPGWALTISLEPTFEIRERCGLSTSTRNQIKRIWPIHLPDMDPEMLAKLVFCFENDPERTDGIISGAQDAIGICMPGLCRHYYNAHYWPERIESCTDERILSWLESHLCMVPMFPRRPGCSVVDGKDITEPHVKALATAAAQCWDAIMQTDLDAFAAAYRASFEAQITLFPAMIQPGVQEYIDQYSAMKDVLAWKMPGAGGGGYLALVVNDATTFCQEHEEAIPLYIRRPA